MACSESRAEEEGDDEEREDVEVWSEKRYFQKKKKVFQICMCVSLEDCALSHLHVCLYNFPWA